MHAIRFNSVFLGGYVQAIFSIFGSFEYGT